MAFGNIKKAKVAEREDGDRLNMEDVVGDVVLFELLSYDPSFEGKFGPTPRVTVNLMVTSGKHKGAEEKNRYLSGNIATQLSDTVETGDTVAVRIATGPSGKGNNWIGIETVSDEDFDRAVKFASKKGKKKSKK